MLGVVLGIAGTLGVLQFPRGDAAPIQISTRLGCVDTVVTQMQPPTDASGAGSGYIGFRDEIAPGHGAANQNIMGVTIAYTTEYPAMSVGDHARVCLVSVPQKSTDNAIGLGCDPAKDVRGRMFVIYDLASGVIAQYANGTHGCGGA